MVGIEVPWPWTLIIFKSHLCELLEFSDHFQELHFLMSLGVIANKLWGILLLVLLFLLWKKCLKSQTKLVFKFNREVKGGVGQGYLLTGRDGAPQAASRGAAGPALLGCWNLTHLWWLQVAVCAKTQKRTHSSEPSSDSGRKKHNGVYKKSFQIGDWLPAANPPADISMLASLL